MESTALQESAQKAYELPSTETGPIERISRLKQAVQSAEPGVCPERTLLWTEYCQDRKNRNKHVYIKIAEALKTVLLNKSIAIYPDELIVGNYSSKRVGGSLHMELAGIHAAAEIFKIPKRKVNPLQISKKDAAKIMATIPYWIRNCLMAKVYSGSLKKQAGLVYKQLKGHTYIINELGGISHIAPDYEKLIKLGTDGIIAEANERQKEHAPDSDQWAFCESVKIIAEGLAQFGERYAGLAESMAASENDSTRKNELTRIAEVCRNVPRKGAKSFNEALQSLTFAQIAIMLESQETSVCPGRMDQYLYPFYCKDLERGVLDRNAAKELLGCFSIKTCEIVPVFSKYIIQFHGGLSNFQSVIVGGVDSDGKDAVNELSYIFIELMDELRMRQPNYHARVHKDSPKEYLEAVYETLARGSNSPAIYNDDVIVDTMVNHGYRIEDARDYAAIGCVEPASQGRSFSSTDAALFNTPIMLELALNQGRRFGSRVRTGAKTNPISSMNSMDDVVKAFETQLQHQLNSLITELKAVEKANAEHHPTPLTSMLLKGCLESGECSTRGGAVYNFSGIQCVGPADTGDALYAIDQLVFKDKKLSLTRLADLLKDNISDEKWLAQMRNLKKFGNDEHEVDAWTVYVVKLFEKTVSSFGKNTRGGDYVTGLYSTTCHKAFGGLTGAMAHGRRKGESFASGIAPVNGMDRKGPTAVINSMNRIDHKKIANGINFNIKFGAAMFKEKTGRDAIKTIMDVYFKRGGMQAQINVLDPAMLKEAKDHPERYPNLLVRVSGYSAYFNDLSPSMKDEIIQRTSNLS